MQRKDPGAVSRRLRRQVTLLRASDASSKSQAVAEAPSVFGVTRTSCTYVGSDSRLPLLECESVCFWFTDGAALILLGLVRPQAGTGAAARLAATSGIREHTWEPAVATEVRSRLIA